MMDRGQTSAMDWEMQDDPRSIGVLRKFKMHLVHNINHLE